MDATDREFERFRGGPTQSKAERVYVTIDKRFVISINNNMHRLLGKPSAVYLHYSRKSDVIAVEPLSSSRLPEAFPVRERSGGGWRINASPFCKHFGIRLDTTERFICPEIHNGKLLLKLTETVTVQNQRRRAPSP